MLRREVARKDGILEALPLAGKEKGSGGLVGVPAKRLYPLLARIESMSEFSEPSTMVD